MSLSSIISYSLPSRLGNVLVGFEESTDVHGLAAPDISVDSPVEGELEGAAVKGAVACVLERYSAPGQWYGVDYRTCCLEAMVAVVS